MVLTVIVNHIALSFPKNILDSTGSATPLNLLYVSILAILLVLLMCNLLKPFPGKDILDIIHHLLDNRGSEKTEFFHAQLSYRETQEILDIIYGKVTLDEYRSIEIILNR